MEKIFLYSWVVSLSLFLLAISFVGIRMILSGIRDSPLNGSLVDNFRAYVVARRMRLRYKGPMTFVRFAEDGELRVMTRTHYCQADLYRAIVMDKEMHQGDDVYRCGESVLYCPKCEVVGERVGENDFPEPTNVDKKGPIGIVR